MADPHFMLEAAMEHFHARTFALLVACALEDDD